MGARRGAAVLAALVAFLAGCAENDGPADTTGTDRPQQTGEPWHDEVKPAQAGGGVGDQGPCRLPVSFDLAPKWRAKAVTLSGGELDELARQGNAVMACEIDAKPAGHIGFLRAWIVPDGAAGPRAALTAYLDADRDISDRQIRDTAAGKLTAVEATYLRKSPLTEENKRERALALPAGKQVVLITLSGLDTDEFEAMLPAYLLAKRTVTAIG